MLAHSKGVLTNSHPCCTRVGLDQVQALDLEEVWIIFLLSDLLLVLNDVFFGIQKRRR